MRLFCADLTIISRVFSINNMSSRQNPLHVSSCYYYGYVSLLGGPIGFQGFVEISIFEIQHEAKILNRFGNGSRSCFVGFRCFGNTSCSFHFAFMCMHVPSFSFHLFRTCSFQCAFMPFHLPFICMHFPFILHSCPFICGNGSMTWPGDRVQQMVIAQIVAKKPLEHMTLFEGNVPQKRQSERERARASEFDAKWYGNCRKQCTTGWISLIGFARSVNVHNSICLVYAKFNGLSCMVPGYRFLGGPIALQSFVHISDKKLRQY